MDSASAKQSIPVKHIINSCCIVALMVVWTYYFYQLVTAYRVSNISISLAQFVIGGLCLCLLALISADFLSGLFHFAGDSFGNINTPIFGKYFIKPFREHHVYPKLITEHNFAELNRNSAIILIGFLIINMILVNPAHSFINQIICTYLLLLTIVLLFANSIHRCAHIDNPSRLVRTLQKFHLIISAEEHLKHHTYPHDSNFCITTGWLNRILDKTIFAWKRSS